MLARWILALALAGALVACGTESDGPEVDHGPDAGDSAGAPDAGVDSPDGAAAELGFMESCDPADDLCAPDLTCFNFNSRGPYCTHDCGTDDDCPAPSRGCNNMGVCKAP